MLHVLDHPLAAHVITHLRDKTTRPATFRTLCYQITLLLAIEATRDLPTEPKAIGVAHLRMQSGFFLIAGFGRRHGLMELIH